MVTSTDKTTHSLQVRRTIPASPQRVYQAWTDPKILADWFAPSADFTTIVHGADARVGGAYRIEMRNASGASHIAVGEYRELVPGKRLAFTWRWAEKAGMTETLVTVEFQPEGTQTVVVLTHTLFQTPADRDDHTKGWNGCLSRLAALA